MNEPHEFQLAHADEQARLHEETKRACEAEKRQRAALAALLEAVGRDKPKQSPSCMCWKCRVVRAHDAYNAANGETLEREG